MEQRIMKTTCEQAWHLPACEPETSIVIGAVLQCFCLVRPLLLASHYWRSFAGREPSRVESSKRSAKLA